MAKQFNREAVKRWRREMWKELHRIGFQDDNDSYVGLVVMAVYGFGTGVQTLAEVTGRGESFVRDVLKRMRRARILKGQALSVRWDQDGMDGAVALGCDILATVGEIERVASPKRSAAQRKAVKSKPAATRRKAVSVSASAIFTPKIRKGDAWYQASKLRGSREGNQ